MIEQIQLLQFVREQNMHNLIVIRKSTRTSLSRELAEQILERCVYGKIAIVADKPASMLSSTKKQVAQLIRRLQRERSSTLDSRKISELTQDIAWMQSLRFSSKVPRDLLDADVTYGVVDDFARFPPICSTIYITNKPEKEKLYMLTSWVNRGGRVIIYERG